MGAEPDNLVLIYLRRLDTKLDDLKAEVVDLKHRMTTLEIQAAQTNATMVSHYANVMLRMDGIETRLERVERRLDLLPA